MWKLGSVRILNDTLLLYKTAPEVATMSKSWHNEGWAANIYFAVNVNESLSFTTEQALSMPKISSMAILRALERSAETLKMHHTEDLHVCLVEIYHCKQCSLLLRNLRAVDQSVSSWQLLDTFSPSLKGIANPTWRLCPNTSPSSAPCRTVSDWSVLLASYVPTSTPPHLIAGFSAAATLISALFDTPMAAL